MLEHLIETYGYWAVLVGTFLEGETILVLAGFAAHQSYLQLPALILAACCGSLCGDQLLFYLGRRHSAFVLRRRPAWKQRIERVKRKLIRYRNLFLVSFRFLYGLRIVTPFMVGMSSVPTLVFVMLQRDALFQDMTLEQLSIDSTGASGGSFKFYAGGFILSIVLTAIASALLFPPGHFFGSALERDGPDLNPADHDPLRRRHALNPIKNMPFSEKYEIA